LYCTTVDWPMLAGAVRETYLLHDPDEGAKSWVLSDSGCSDSL
jgi:hypothetical protein